jgi:putative two-component system response regulator
LGLTLGAVDYITKPFTQLILLKRVELHLLLQKKTKELFYLNENLLSIVNERIQDISALQNAIISWVAEVIEFRDEATGQHVERVQKYLGILLDEMKATRLYADEIAEWDIGAFIRSALLHDVGKIKIHNDILLKNSGLSEDEFTTMKLHSEYGKELIESLQSKIPDQKFLEYAKIVAHRHHERWDGTGYPDGLSGEEIPLQARLMALADVYDALISDRPYKKARTHEDAIRIIFEGRGTQFDPLLVDLFVSVSDKVRVISQSISSSN